MRRNLTMFTTVPYISAALARSRVLPVLLLVRPACRSAGPSQQAEEIMPEAARLKIASARWSNAQREIYPEKMTHQEFGHRTGRVSGWGLSVCAMIGKGRDR